MLSNRIKEKRLGGHAVSRINAVLQNTLLYRPLLQNEKEHVKAILKELWNSGHVRMTNYSGSINFKKRFDVVKNRQRFIGEWHRFGKWHRIGFINQRFWKWIRWGIGKQFRRWSGSFHFTFLNKWDSIVMTTAATTFELMKIWSKQTATTCSNTTIKQWKLSVKFIFFFLFP